METPRREIVGGAPAPAPPGEGRGALALTRRERLAVGVLAISAVALAVASLGRERSRATGELVRARAVVPVDVNRAGVEELSLLRGVGPALAERIVADRAARGPFRGIADLARVRGVDRRLIAGIADQIVAGDVWAARPGAGDEGPPSP